MGTGPLAASAATRACTCDPAGGRRQAGLEIASEVLSAILLNGTKSKLDVTTDLQVFGLLVTAGPYFPVTRPSDPVVMENAQRADTTGKIQAIGAQEELLHAAR
jgi:hypothetical protein